MLPAALPPTLLSPWFLILRSLVVVRWIGTICIWAPLELGDLNRQNFKTLYFPLVTLNHLKVERESFSTFIEHLLCAWWCSKLRPSAVNHRQDFYPLVEVYRCHEVTNATKTEKARVRNAVAQGMLVCLRALGKATLMSTHLSTDLLKWWSEPWAMGICWEVDLKERDGWEVGIM